MINRNEITKIAKKILNSNKQLKNPQLMYPEREWSIGMVVSIFIFVGTAYWSANTYSAYQNISTNQVDDSQTNVSYRDTLVKAALEKFSLRHNEYNLLIGVTNQPTQIEETVTEVEVVETDTNASSISALEETIADDTTIINESETVADENTSSSTPADSASSSADILEATF